MRNMSFSKTTEQMRTRKKWVTRRYGWWDLEIGDRLQAVEKGMGLKKGEKVKKICVIEVVNQYRDDLRNLDQEDCVAEGFPDKSVDEVRALIESLCPIGRGEWPNTPNRIEFKYVD